MEGIKGKVVGVQVDRKENEVEWLRYVKNKTDKPTTGKC